MGPGKYSPVVVANEAGHSGKLKSTAPRFLKKAQTEFPKDWTGDGEDVKGIKEDMRIFCDNLKKTGGQAA